MQKWGRERSQHCIVDGMIDACMSKPAEHILFTRLHPDAVAPTRAHAWDAGLDLVAVESLTLLPGERGVVGTGIAVAIPEGWGGFVVPRSGLARRQGITLTNSPGLIDAGYRGELQILVINHDSAPQTLTAGERIAQLVLIPVGMMDAIETTELPDSDGRATGGFGSSGR
jgi:dUTP pyrophosphatase